MLVQPIPTMKLIWWSLLIVALGTSRVYTVSDFVAYNCTDLGPLLRKEYFCDNFLVSRLITENQSLNSLIKYLNYSISGINKELKETCTNFAGAIKEQIFHCPDRPLFSTCRETMRDGSGIYRLKSKRQSGATYLVYCMEDMEGGDPWTIIQRRIENDVTFNRKWADYENGFGNVYGSYWLGLKEIYAIMNGSPYELWIELMDFDNFSHYAKYDEFILGDGDREYPLLNLGAYTGTAGNSLRVHLGRKFSANDKANDGDKSCAKSTKGAWWFSSCGQSHLNGEYYMDSQPTEKGKGIFWNGWKGLFYSYKYVHMAIREKISSSC